MQDAAVVVEAAETLFPTREEKQKYLLEATPPPGMTWARFSAIKRLIWAIEITPPDSRKAALLCSKMCCSVANYNTVLALAQQLHWLQIEHHAGKLSHFFIDWHKIRSPAVWTKLEASNIGGLQKKLEASNKNWRPPESAQISGSARKLEASSAHDHVYVNKPSIHTHSMAPGRGKKPGRKAGQGPGGWPIFITIKTLSDAREVQKLFEHAALCGWCEDWERVHFFALARACRRGEVSKFLKSCGATFTAKVKAKDWVYAIDEDREKAAEAIRWLDARLPIGG